MHECIQVQEAIQGIFFACGRSRVWNHAQIWHRDGGQSIPDVARKRSKAMSFGTLCNTHHVPYNGIEIDIVSQD